jgi:hypothetical protein
LVRKAMRDLGFRAEEVVVVGDSGADRRAAGVTGYAWPPRAGLDGTAHDFRDAA